MRTLTTQIMKPTTGDPIMDKAIEDLAHIIGDTKDLKEENSRLKKEIEELKKQKWTM